MTSAVGAASNELSSTAELRDAVGGRASRPGVSAADIPFWLAVVYLVFLLVAGIAPGLIAGHDPLEITTSILRPPSAAHWLGTDENGRDIYARLVYGCRDALLLGFGSIAIAIVGGSVLGIAAGLGGRVVSSVIMRLVDVGMAFPEMLLALIVIAATGGGTLNAALAIGIAGIPSFARLVRAQVLTIRDSGYVEVARGLGQSSIEVVLRHVLPNALRPIAVLATIGVGTASVVGAGLSFIGLGTPPPAPSWGVMLSTAQNFLSQSPLYAVFPGLAITLLVLSATIVGRRLQRRWNGAR